MPDTLNAHLRAIQPSGPAWGEKGEPLPIGRQVAQCYYATLFVIAPNGHRPGSPNPRRVSGWRAARKHHHLAVRTEMLRGVRPRPWKAPGTSNKDVRVVGTRGRKLLEKAELWRRRADCLGPEAGAAMNCRCHGGTLGSRRCSPAGWCHSVHRTVPFRWPPCTGRAFNLGSALGQATGVGGASTGL